MTSPLRAEVYLLNMKTFTDLKWGTRDPVAFKDTELGLIRLRAHGVFNLQVVQPLLFINSLVGTRGIFTTEEIAGYLNRVIVSRFNDFMGETLDSLLNLPAQYDEFSQGLSKRLKADFERFGLGLTHLYINAITPPPEVQEAIDDRSRIGVFDDMDRLMKMKAAMAMEKAAQAGQEGGAGMGTSLGLMMPAMFAQYFTAGRQPAATEKPDSASCQECGHQIPVDARFCPLCGHQQLVFQRCESCGKNITPNAKFCSRCGKAVEAAPAQWVCAGCGSENLPDARFCNQCGDKR
jgi:membrane protease subunit (stomatin/prohibitin family)